MRGFFIGNDSSPDTDTTSSVLVVTFGRVMNFVMFGGFFSVMMLRRGGGIRR
jgi:hypothetical protein